MHETQQFYHTYVNDELVVYMVNIREKRYCIIPKQYEGLYKHLYSTPLHCYDGTINPIIEKYGLEEINLDSVNG